MAIRSPIAVATIDVRRLVISNPAKSGGRPNGRPRLARALALLARVARALDHCCDLIEVPALRGLNGRERLVGLELLEPELLPERQDVPVVYVGRGWRGDRAHHPAASLFPLAPTRLEGIALEVYDAGHELVLHSISEAPRGFGRDRENQLPVLIADCRRLRAGIVEEDIARGLVGLARQVVDLIEAVERRLSHTLIGPLLEL